MGSRKALAMTVGTEQDSDQTWLAHELADVSLGDKRLDWRLLDTGSKLAANPGASINQACDDWADTRASYRLFGNKKTTVEKILTPHMARTRERASKYKRVLSIQDTTFLDYTHHPDKDGMGPIGTTQQTLTGMVMHSALLTNDLGLPLGLASQEIWVRPEEAKQLDSEERRQLPIEEKESNKWLTALSKTVEVVPPETQVITVGDSESDIFELFDHACTLETDLLVRAAQDRAVCEPEVGLLWSVLGSKAIAGHLNVKVRARNNEPKRDAIVSVRHAKVKLRAPRRLRSKMKDMPLYAVLVQEEEPPAGVEKPLCWLLLTTVPVHSFQDAIERIQWYRIRWEIEVYHKILKSGCHVEKSQLAKADRIRPLIALYCIIAWRLFWLTHMTRHEPDAPCTVVLTDHEWRSLYAYHHKSNRTPDALPTVAQVTLWIAQLGGFLARKSDGHPGVTVIWRGWTRLQDISALWDLRGLTFPAVPAAPVYRRISGEFGAIDTPTGPVLLSTP